MKKLILFGIIILMVIPGVFAQIRLDLAIEVPVILGVKAESDNVDINESINVLNDIGTFVLPTGMAAYQIPVGPVNAGIGIKGYSLLIESVVWPVIYAELDLSPFVIHANVGGLQFLWFGIIPDINGLKGSSVIIPDFHVAYKFGKTFRLGIGAMAITGIKGLEGITPYNIYLTGRFSILFDKDK